MTLALRLEPLSADCRELGVIHADSPVYAQEVEQLLHARFPEVSIDRGEQGPPLVE